MEHIRDEIEAEYRAKLKAVALAFAGAVAAVRDARGMETIARNLKVALPYGPVIPDALPLDIEGGVKAIDRLVIAGGVTVDEINSALRGE